MRRREGARRALVLSAAASWRVSLLLTAALAVPAASTIALIGLMFSERVALACSVSAVGWLVSVFVHELGHVLAHLALRAEGDDHDIAPLGTWTHAGVVRRAVPGRDHWIALAGPGAVLALAAGVYALDRLLGTPWPAWLMLPPFAVHLLSLLPRYPDGRALFAALHDHRLGSAPGRA